MEIYHKIENINNQNIVVIYVNYPSEYEFSLDFDSIKKNVSNVADKIRQYAMKNVTKISDNTALLILNGVVIGTIMVSQLVAPKINAQTLKNNVEQSETITGNSDTSIKEDKQEETKAEEGIQNTITETGEKKEEPAKQEEIKTVTQAKQTTSTAVTTPVKQPAKTTTAVAVTPAPTQITPAPAQTTPTVSDKMISVRLSTNQVIQVPLEEYIVGVVGAEVPALFHTETLKAQAIASRTYTMNKTSRGETLVASSANQNYKTKEELQKMWGSSFDSYYLKVKNAVNETKGKVLTVNGKYIDALYFSTSNGKTEDSIYVWGNSYSYLKSVDSPWDVGISSYSYTKVMTLSEVSSKLGVNLTSMSQINVISKTTGDRINKISFCGKEFTGVKIRELLVLRSTDFEISINGSNVTFVTKGYGHGVGMSQYGANEYAKKGASYDTILKHYYTGVSITNI